MKKTNTFNINDIWAKKHPNCIISISEEIIDEKLSKIDKMNEEMLTKTTQASQLYSEVRVLESEKYNYIHDIFYGHDDSPPMFAGGLLSDTCESSEDRRKSDEEREICAKARLDALIDILRMNKQRIIEERRNIK